MHRPPVHRLFYALKPPEDALAYIAHEQWHLGPGNEVQPCNFHITLAITNDFVRYPDHVEQEMRRIGNGIHAVQCAVVLDRALASATSVALRPSRKLEGVDQLHHMLRAGMRGSPVDLREGWGYGAHLTLLYRRGMPFARSVLPVSWYSTEFVLIHSLVGQGRHRIVERWPLITRQRSTLH